jgi:perosamine synthetase
VIPRGAPYIGWADLFAAATYTIARGDAATHQRRVEAAWGAPDSLAVLSVRSGLDALLAAVRFPRESEVIVSAITIPHILDILAHHGLVAVPVDLDTTTLAVDPAAVRNAITPRTRAVLAAHLFGSRMPMDGIIGVARDHGLLVIEDCAQANDGNYQGHPDADVRLFSFGAIKRQSAIGGGILVFRDSTLHNAVRDVVRAYPRQTTGDFARRLATMAAIKAVSHRSLFSAFVRWCQLTGRDHDRTLGVALRGFARGNLIERLRRQPSVPQLRLLARRLRQPVAPDVAKRVAIVDSVVAAFPDLPRPGTRALVHTHWLFPITSARPDDLVRALWHHGYDATRGASNLVCVPVHDGGAPPAGARALLANVLYLPLAPDVTPDETRRMAADLRRLVAG